VEISPDRNNHPPAGVKLFEGTRAVLKNDLSLLEAIMFDQVLVESTARTRRPVAVALSFGGQVLVLGIIILLPLFHTEAITAGRMLHIFTPPPATEHTERIVSEHTAVPYVRRSGSVLRVFTDRMLRAPARVPDVILEDDSPPANVFAGTSGPVIPGALNGVAGGIGYEIPALPKPAPPAVSPKPPLTAKPVVVGGDVQAAKLIHQVTPVYPTLAKQARVSGTVYLEAIIDRNGTIESLRVKSGSGLLAPAAVDAVRQWRYRPTLLNGVPVEVMTEIEVNFKLSQ
jgi:protein TonB